MILHLIDDHIAASSFLKGFMELFPTSNIIMRFCRGGKVEVVKDTAPIVFNSAKEAMSSIDFSLVKVIVVQLLTTTKSKAIATYVPRRVPVVWWTYGGDLYNRVLQREGYELYSSQTRFFNQTHEKKGLLLKMKMFLYDGLFIKYCDKKVIERTEGIIPCLYPDYEQACKWLNKKFELVDVTPWQEILDCPLTRGNNIMIGHSASLTNNHLYALDILKGMELDDSLITLPLSYNIQSEAYRKEVMRKYRETYGDKVNFLLELMDLQTYKKNFLNYKMAIFPCWRQEALGNIFTCIQLGLRIVMSNHNPCYKYLCDLGFIISSLEDLRDLKPLVLEEQQKNRSLFIRLKKERDVQVVNNMKNYFSKYLV